MWRKLERLGVARLGDGLVAVPADARTREHIGWLADEIVEGGGSASVWLSVPATRAQEEEIASGMRAARAAEYRAVLDQAVALGGVAEPERSRTVRRLRAELHRIARRDYFAPPERDAARLAVQATAEGLPAIAADHVGRSRGQA